MSRKVVFSERQTRDVKVTRIERSNKMRTKKLDKCSTLENALKHSLWLNTVLDDSESSLSSSNEYLFKHLSSECKCTPRTHIELIIGCNFYQLFLLRLKQFNCKISDHESRPSTKDESHEKSGEDIKLNESKETLPTSPYPNAEAHKPSKYEYEIFAHLVNKNSCENILSPLKTALQHWEKAIRTDFVDPLVLTKFQMSNNLISCFYIFENFDILSYKYRSATLVLSVAFLMNDLMLQLQAYYLLIQVYIQNGAINKAKSYLKKAEIILTDFNFKKTQSFETSLIFLAQCEVGLYSAKPELHAIKLKQFIESDYLQRLSLNRYYLKGLALALAAKFPSNVYQFSETFQEFVEPVVISITLLGRWNRSYFANAKQKEDMTDIDPLWLRFAVYDFSLKIYKTAITFYVNIGTPTDIAYFYNALFKIGRRNCFLLWIVRLLISAAEIDLLCDKRKPALTKLNVAAAMYINNSNYLTSKSGSNDSSDSVIYQNVICSSWGGLQNYDLDAEVVPSPKKNISDTADDCAHNEEIPVWRLRKILLKNGDSSDVDNSSDEVFLKSDEHSQFIEEKEDEFIRFNFLNNYVYLCLNLLQDSSKKCLTDRLEELHAKIIENTEASFVSKLSGTIGIDSSEIQKLFSIDSSYVQLKLINYLSQALLKCGNFSRIVELSETFLQQSKQRLVFGIEVKTVLADIIFKYAKAKFALYNKQSSIIQYNASQMEEVLNSEIKTECRTPSPNRRSKKQMAPQAPKGKNEFKMDEFKEYLEALSKLSTKKTTETKVKRDQQKSRIERNPRKTDRSSNDLDDILKIDAIYSTTKAKSKRMTFRSTTKSNKILNAEFKLQPSITNFEANDDNIENNLDSPHSSTSDCSIYSNISCFEEIQKMLLNILNFFGNHPPSHLYRDIHFLLFQITAVNTCNERTAHHFSEATTASSIRYRNILLSDKKKKKNMDLALNLESFAFNPDVDTNSDFLQNCLADLPSSWRICQLHAVSNNTAIPDIYVARYQFGKGTLFFKINGNSEFFLQDFMSELYEIIELSNGSISNKDLETFWKVRFALDNRFKVLMNGVDDMWFGPFKGLFMGQILDKSFCEMCSEIKSKILQLFQRLTCKDEPMLDMIVESYALLTNEQYLFWLTTLFGDKTVAKKCLLECEKIFHQYYPIDEKSTIFENLKIEPLALILNKPLVAFPFEALPTPVMLKQEIFRVPSVRFLAVLYKSFKSKASIFGKGVDPRNVYYLLNPANNLSKTEQYFKDKFLKQSDWDGSIGSAPNGVDFKKSLESRDLYIFFGHGAGSCYYRLIPDGLEGAAVKSASIVIGCCSGKLVAEGESFEPHGIPLRFIINGSPTFLGILWDVTDRDIDRFADRLLQHLIPSWTDEHDLQSSSICNAVVRSRDACKLKYLIGASPVVYGLPISVLKQ